MPPSSPQGSCTSPDVSEPFHSTEGSAHWPDERRINYSIIRFGKWKTVIFEELSIKHFSNQLVTGWTFWGASWLTCMFSSSLTRDQLLMKLWLSRARTGELSRTVSRRVRPEPIKMWSRQMLPCHKNLLRSIIQIHCSLTFERQCSPSYTKT